MQFLSELDCKWGEEKVRKGGWGQVRNTLNNMRSLNFVAIGEPLKVFEQENGMVKLCFGKKTCKKLRIDCFGGVEQPETGKYLDVYYLCLNKRQQRLCLGPGK